MKLELRKQLLQKRIWRIRKKVSGTPERPRLCVTFTHKHIYAQAIDDTTGRTLLAVTTLNKDLRASETLANREGAKKVGQAFGERALAAGLSKVVLDRHGRRYHGRVKDFADAARAAGLQF